MKRPEREPQARSLRDQFGFLRAFRPLLERLGADYDEVMEILVLKATVLLRTEQSPAQAAANRQPAFFSIRRNLQTLVLSLLVSAIAWLYAEPSAMLALIFVPGFMMQVLRVITTFPVLIIETRDITLLATQPVRPASVSAAKNLLVVLYLFTESLCLYAFAFVPFAVKGHFLVLPGLLLAVLMANFTCVVLVYLLYGLVLRLYDGEKLKDLITLLQIILNIVVILFSNLVSRATAILGPESTLIFRWWHLAVPPFGLAWIGAMFSSGSALLPGLASLAVLTALSVFHFSCTARLVDKNLGKLLREGEQKRSGYEFRRKLRERLAGFLFRDQPSRAFFLFSSAIVDNDRKVKQLVYPQLASALLMPAIILFSSWQATKASLADLFGRAPLLMVSFYFSVLVLLGTFSALFRCEKPAGHWFFGMVATISPQRANHASGLVFIFRFLLAPLGMVSLLLLLAAGPGVLPQLLPLLSGALALGLFKLRLAGPRWPHAMELLAVEAKSLRRSLLELAQVAAVAALHAAAFLLFADSGLYILSLVFAAVAALLWMSKERRPGQRAA